MALHAAAFGARPADSSPGWCSSSARATNWMSIGGVVRMLADAVLAAHELAMSHRWAHVQTEKAA